MPVPGVEIKRIRKEGAPVQSSGTVVAMVGPANKGPMYEPTYVYSSKEFENIFGDSIPGFEYPNLAQLQLFNENVTLIFQRVGVKSDTNLPSLKPYRALRSYLEDLKFYEVEPRSAMYIMNPLDCKLYNEFTGDIITMFYLLKDRQTRYFTVVKDEVYQPALPYGVSETDDSDPTTASALEGNMSGLSANVQYPFKAGLNSLIRWFNGLDGQTEKTNRVLDSTVFFRLSSTPDATVQWIGIDDPFFNKKGLLVRYVGPEIEIPLKDSGDNTIATFGTQEEFDNGADAIVSDAIVREALLDTTNWAFSIDSQKPDFEKIVGTDSETGLPYVKADGLTFEYVLTPTGGYQAVIKTVEKGDEAELLFTRVDDTIFVESFFNKDIEYNAGVDYRYFFGMDADNPSNTYSTNFMLGNIVANQAPAFDWIVDAAANFEWSWAPYEAIRVVFESKYEGDWYNGLSVQFLTKNGLNVGEKMYDIRIWDHTQSKVLEEFEEVDWNKYNADGTINSNFFIERINNKSSLVQVKIYKDLEQNSVLFTDFFKSFFIKKTGYEADYLQSSNFRIYSLSPNGSDATIEYTPVTDTATLPDKVLYYQNVDDDTYHIINSLINIKLRSGIVNDQRTYSIVWDEAEGTSPFAKVSLFSAQSISGPTRITPINSSTIKWYESGDAKIASTPYYTTNWSDDRSPDVIFKYIPVPTGTTDPDVRLVRVLDGAVYNVYRVEGSSSTLVDPADFTVPPTVFTFLNSKAVSMIVDSLTHLLRNKVLGWKPVEGLTQGGQQVYYPYILGEEDFANAKQGFDRDYPVDPYEELEADIMSVLWNKEIILKMSGGKSGWTHHDTGTVISGRDSAVPYIDGIKELGSSVWDFELLYHPGCTNTIVIQKTYEMMMAKHDFFYIIDAPFGMTRNEVKRWHNGENGGPALNHEHCAIYWNWPTDFDTKSNKVMYVPPSCQVAKAFISIENRYNLWYPHAGEQYALISTVADEDHPNGFEWVPEREDIQALYGNPEDRVNVLLSQKPSGPVIWGQKTMYAKSFTSPLTRVDATVTVIRIEREIKRNLRRFVFERITPESSALALAVINEILGRYLKAGAIEGIEGAAEITTENDKANYIRVFTAGVKPYRTAEAIKLYFSVS